MNTHFDNLLDNIPDLHKRKMLDVGSGRGNFLIDVTGRGCDIIGIEKNVEYIKKFLSKVKAFAIKSNVINGVGENLPFSDNSFDFVNMSEVIEHVDNPQKVFSEVFRVLRKNGLVYISFPSRFGFKDPHFHLYFVNWLPRCFSGLFISIFGKHKDYSCDLAGIQSLCDMHYYTFGKILKETKKIGFGMSDIREIKIRNNVKNKILCNVAVFLYKFLRIFCFDSFHILLKKN